MECINLTIFQTWSSASVNGSSTSVHIIDPSNEAILDDPKYGPVCVQTGSTRRFKCVAQDARSDVCDISWKLGSERVDGIAAKSLSKDGLVNVSSLVLVTNPGDDTKEKNLTCIATSCNINRQSLAANVLLTFCAGEQNKKL